MLRGGTVPSRRYSCSRAVFFGFSNLVRANFAVRLADLPVIPIHTRCNYTPTRCEPEPGATTMFKKSVLTLSAALLLAATFVSASNAQTARKEVGSFTAAEKLWFQIPEAADRMN